jgi:hypothetical protein
MRKSKPVSFHITAAWLRRRGACSEGIYRFQSVFPRGVWIEDPSDIASMLLNCPIIERQDCRWFLHHLNPHLSRVFESVLDSVNSLLLYDKPLALANKEEALQGIASLAWEKMYRDPRRFQ